MRHWLAHMVVVSLLALGAGCGDDDGGNTPDAGGGGDGGGNAPVISKVAWTPITGCRVGTASNFTITITATDPQTPANQLTYNATAVSCTGTVTAMTGSLNCPNSSSYVGTATVTDPEGNKDTQTFTMSPCAAGMAP